MDIQEVSLVRFDSNDFSKVHVLLPYGELACSMEIPSGVMLRTNIVDVLRLGSFCGDCLNGFERVLKDRDVDYVSNFFGRNIRLNRVDALEELRFLRSRFSEKHNDCIVLVQDTIVD